MKPSYEFLSFTPLPSFTHLKNLTHIPKNQVYSACFSFIVTLFLINLQHVSATDLIGIEVYFKFA